LVTKIWHDSRPAYCPEVHPAPASYLEFGGAAENFKYFMPITVLVMLALQKDKIPQNCTYSWDCRKGVARARVGYLKTRKKFPVLYNG